MNKNERNEKNKVVYEGYKKLEKQFSLIADIYSKRKENPDHKKIEEIYRMISVRMGKIAEIYEQTILI